MPHVASTSRHRPLASLPHRLATQATPTLPPYPLIAPTLPLVLVHQCSRPRHRAAPLLHMQCHRRELLFHYHCFCRAKPTSSLPPARRRAPSSALKQPRVYTKPCRQICPLPHPPLIVTGQGSLQPTAWCPCILSARRSFGSEVCHARVTEASYHHCSPSSIHHRCRSPSGQPLAPLTPKMGSPRPLLPRCALLAPPRCR
jgi:hypothetical protein